MLKPLIFLLVIVILIAIGLNFDFFNTAVEPIKQKKVTIIEHHTKEKEIKHVSIAKEVIFENNSSTDNNLTKELEKLLEIASKYFQKGDDSEAFKVYDEIIKKSEKSTNPKILKFFADAQFSKAFLHNIYPHNDKESAIEDYENIIDKFVNSDNIELLKLYMTAKLEQAKLLSKEDLLLAYDELINKFEKDKEQRFDKEVEQFLFAKSFALMGVNDEEAIEVLDSLIAKYQDKGVVKLPETVQFSILNNIELSLITNNSDEKYVDLAEKYMRDSPEIQPLVDMLKIIKDAQDLNQDDAFTKWKEKHATFNFPAWNFDELNRWVNNMEDLETKMRVSSYLKAFEKEKYSRNTYVPYEPSSENTQAPIVYEANENQEEYEVPVYEPDPYINDIYQGSSPYPDPYATTTSPYSDDSENNIYANPYE